MIVEDLVSAQDTVAGDTRKLHAIDSFTEKRELLNITNCEKYEGDGDMYPTSFEGKMIATLTMMVGVLALALPVSVIGANFADIYG